MIVFSVAFLRRADTVFASARPGVADKTDTGGTGKPVPYKGAVQNSAAHSCYAKRHGFLRSPEPGNKILCRIHVTRGTHGFARTLEPGTGNNRIRSCVNSPLKILDRGGTGV